MGPAGTPRRPRHAPRRRKCKRDLATGPPQGTHQREGDRGDGRDAPMGGQRGSCEVSHHMRRAQASPQDALGIEAEPARWAACPSLLGPKRTMEALLYWEGLRLRFPRAASPRRLEAELQSSSSNYFKYRDYRLTTHDTRGGSIYPAT